MIRCRSWIAPASCDIGGAGSIRTFKEQSLWADVIHYHYPWPFADVLNLWVRPDKPKVMTYHSDVVRQRVLGALYRPLMSHTLRDMDFVVATSPSYAKSSGPLTEDLSADRLRVIPLGIEEMSYPRSGDERVLHRLGLTGGEPFILFVGVLRYYKGLYTLLDACGQVKHKVVIAGSGPEEKLLRESADNSGLRNVIFSGQVTEREKVALLKACRAVVLPSHLRSEAYGMVLVEASMFGKPMVSCEIGTGTSFVNRDKETGFVVAPEDVGALAQAMNSLLVRDDLAYSFGVAARQRYEALLSGAAMGNAYTHLYEEAASKCSLVNGR